jgi:S1-C subfamily serine protease
MAPAVEGQATRRPEPDDDRTFRPTVMVRKKASQGSGTVIASVEGETLILTAAHVVEGAGPLWVELHRYNFGVEKSEPSGAWPLAVKAEVAATDPAGDLAVIRLRGCPPLPYVARLAPGDEEPARGSLVTSVGIDGGTKLNSWRTEVGGVAWLTMQEGSAGRPFLVLKKPPLHGRSGGGLFRADGSLVGVCVGRIEFLKRTRQLGLFASGASIRRMLRDHDLDGAIVRSEAAANRTLQAGKPATRSGVTPTRAKPSR